jgi:hypothetical protein
MSYDLTISKYRFARCDIGERDLVPLWHSFEKNKPVFEPCTRFEAAFIHDNGDIVVWIDSDATRRSP